jgi:small-conductance mechanosensitive channel
MIKEWITHLANLPYPIIEILIGLFAGLLINWVVSLSLSLATRRSKSSDLLILRNRCKKTFNIFLPILTILIALSYSGESAWLPAITKTFTILLIITSTFLLIRLVYALEDIFLERYNIDKEDNRKERKVITQLNFLKKVVIIALVLLALAILLLSFEDGRKYGQTLLTSAGVASIILGFAAQKSIGNFLAGIQIAFTQPIKIDDAVLVENEWGWIEEINLTYVVVRLWDWRRLVLPITYFVEKPFQNWTRNKGELIGAVFLYLDYRTPIEKLRIKLAEILENEPLWDRQVQALQIVETQEFTIKVRALMSSKTSPTTFDLRCSVREKLIEFLRTEHPESLPMYRLSLDAQSELS